MTKQEEGKKVRPETIKSQIDLPNKKTIKVNTDAVKNTGMQATPEKIVKSLKKAAKEALFPPVMSSQNG